MIKKKILSNGMVKLTSPKGVIDTRDNNKTKYREAIVKEKDIIYFIEA